MMISAFLGRWILGLSGAAIFCAVMGELCPKGTVKAVVKTLCGIVMVMAFLSPLLNLEPEDYSLNLAKYRAEGEKAASGGQAERDLLSRTIIEEECRAYILDKARGLGADVVDASVKLRWSSEGVWYPVECEITGSYHGGLASAISAELGIGEESQVWSKNENN